MITCLEHSCNALGPHLNCTVCGLSRWTHMPTSQRTVLTLLKLRVVGNQPRTMLHGTKPSHRLLGNYLLRSIHDFRHLHASGTLGTASSKSLYITRQSGWLPAYVAGVLPPARNFSNPTNSTLYCVPYSIALPSPEAWRSTTFENPPQKNSAGAPTYSISNCAPHNTQAS